MSTSDASPRQSSRRSLRHSEAIERAELLTVESYDVELDLAADEETFASRTTIRFRAEGAGRSFLDVAPVALLSAVLDGVPLDPATLDAGRLGLTVSAGAHELVVDAVMGFRTDGEGLHHHTDPADGRRYVYGMSFMDAAPSVFACFDQPDLKAPYTFTVRAPIGWTVTGNAAGEQVEPGVWRLERSQPLSTYFVTLVAGPYHHIADTHDGIRLGLSCRRSIAPHLDADADELLTLTKQCFDEFHRLFAIRYPFGDYHQAFVPEFNAGAMENPGCVTFRDPLVFTSRVTRGARIQRATTLAHEMAHQWFGNLVTPRWWDDLWLNESFAEYMGNRVTADVTQYGDAWVHNAHRRRQWGLVADQRPSTHPVAGNGASDAAGALQDFDGISYAKGSSVLKQLAARLGDDVFFAGVIDHFERHRFSNATMHDLFGSWERAGAGDLSDFLEQWLRRAGVDRLTHERDSGLVVRTAPPSHPAERTHTIRVAHSLPGPAARWQVDHLQVGRDGAAWNCPAGAAVVLDAYEDSWSLSSPDAVTLAALPDLIATTTDPMLRAGIWNALRTGVHLGELSPADAVAVVESGLPTERDDDAVAVVGGWAIGRLRAVIDDPVDLDERIHTAALRLLDVAHPGSTLQLATYGLLIATARSTSMLRAALDGVLPDGLALDEAVRWRILQRLALLAEVRAEDLDAELAAAPSAVARVEHARARASLPTAEAKAWAWRYFTGESEASNYEIEAAGRGMWQRGQEALTEPYVDRYLAEVADLGSVFSGWLLVDVAESFFPITARTTRTVERLVALTADPRAAVPGTVRRRVIDLIDEVERRL